MKVIKEKNTKIKTNNNGRIVVRNIASSIYTQQKRQMENIREGIIGIVDQEKSHIADLSGYIPAAKRNRAKTKVF